MMDWESLKKLTYSPYSGKLKACVVESKTGKFYTGVRIENVAYPLTIPAVQAACSICLSEGETPAAIYVEDEDYDQIDFWTKEFDLNVIHGNTLPKTSENLLCTTPLEDVPKKLKELLDKAVVPNSDFPVSALLFVDGGYFEGVNIEVSDWTKGLCAERTAISKALSAGCTEFTRLDVHTRKGEISSPCGACRQVIIEHLPYHKIGLHHADGTLSEHLTVDLLPFSFKSTGLKN